MAFFFFWYHSVCLNNHYNKLWLSKMDRQLKSYFLSCLLTWVAQFNFRIAFKALKEKKNAVCLSWLKKCKYSCCSPSSVALPGGDLLTRIEIGSSTWRYAWVGCLWATSVRDASLRGGEGGWGEVLQLNGGGAGRIEKAEVLSLFS